MSDLGSASLWIPVVFFGLGLRQLWIYWCVRGHRLSSTDRVALQADLETLEHGPVRRELASRLRSEGDPGRPLRLALGHFAIVVGSLVMIGRSITP